MKPKAYLAATNGVEYLVPWNCWHIANPQMRLPIERVCRDADGEPPIICTPDEMLATDYEDPSL